MAQCSERVVLLFVYGRDDKEKFLQSFGFNYQHQMDQYNTKQRKYHKQKTMINQQQTLIEEPIAPSTPPDLIHFVAAHHDDRNTQPLAVAPILDWVQSTDYHALRRSLPNMQMTSGASPCQVAKALRAVALSLANAWPVSNEPLPMLMPTIEQPVESLIGKKFNFQFKFF